MPFRLDEGFSEDSASPDEHGRMFAATAARFQEWVLAQNEDARAEIAYEILRTLRTSHISGVVDRLTPLLHMDPMEKLPQEITLQIFAYLDAETLLAASLASKTWQTRIMDTMLWQELYRLEGWGLNEKEIRRFESSRRSAGRQQSKKGRAPSHGQPSLKKRVTSDWFERRQAILAEASTPVPADVYQWREQHGPIEVDTDMQSETDDLEMQDALARIQNSPSRPNKRQSQEDDEDMDYSGDTEGDVSSGKRASRVPEHPFKTRLVVYDGNGEKKLNWVHLYRQRQKLEQNWIKGRYSTFQLPDPSYPHEGHTECVYTIQFFGKWLVSGSRDKTLRVWDLETRRLRGKPLTGHYQSVLCLQFDPTEKEDVIISGSSDASVIIWRFSTGQKIHEIPSAHEESVLNLRFDHRYLVTCSKDRRIKVWSRKHMVATDQDYPEVKPGGHVRVPVYIVNTAEMGPSRLEAGIANGEIQAIKPYMLLLTLEGHSAAVNAIQINGDLIVSASGDRYIKVWNAKTGKLLRTLQGHQKGIACVEFDSKRIVSGSSDNTVRIYDPVTGSEVAELKGHTNLVRTVQAGFGDLPGSNEEDEARRVEKRYLDYLLASGVVLEHRALRQGARINVEGTSRFTIGSRLPPGGGGSKWGRIVSGSYDESIIIWRKNAKGDWVMGQVLRQESPSQQPQLNHRQQLLYERAADTVRTASAARAAPAAQQPRQAPILPSTGNESAAGSVRPAVMSVSHILQQAVNTSFGNFGTGLADVTGLGRALNGSVEVGGPTRNNINLTVHGNSVQSIAQQAAAQAQAAVTQTLNNSISQSRARQAGSTHGGSSTNGHRRTIPHHPYDGPFAATSAAQQQPSQPHPRQQQQARAPSDPLSAATAASQNGQPSAQHAAPSAAASSVSRVFKLQFDARRIVCCSQDSRIVGWDFANGDADVIEACRFFTGP
ncbi:WD domain and F-box domain containing protein [Cladophialophora carrionii]|uniref:Probable E3 ubiquitin ligase complex SCF subunit sconB n=1 Tax=Cladophialophora carrionii TaxID=86049 RepID=A0A1C1CJC7_9EURO|nr:WD domain and F-box domain containing protein [Cladophialophora carrionii]